MLSGVLIVSVVLLILATGILRKSPVTCFVFVFLAGLDESLLEFLMAYLPESTDLLVEFLLEFLIAHLPESTHLLIYWESTL